MATAGDVSCTSTADFSAAAYGQAALILVESLIHGLCEQRGLSTAEAIEIVERAADIQSERAEEASDGQVAMRQAHDLLQSIASSLNIDGSPTEQTRCGPDLTKRS